MLTTYQTDGVRTDYTFEWPYLDRSHIMVTVDQAPRAFKFIDDHTIRVVTLFGEPLPSGGVLKIFRVTPDLVSFAVFKDAANLTADDLNRARLQVLFLIQERSGGLGGSVSQAVQLLVNEIETISGALDSLSETQGILTAGIQTLDDLSARIQVVENGADALHQQILQEIADRSAEGSSLVSRMDQIEVNQGNLRASVTSDINLLQSQTDTLASKTDTISARLDNIEIGAGTNEGDGNDDQMAAALITAAIADVKSNHALAKRIDTLEASINDDIRAMVQTEQEARVSADSALAQQITTLQAEIGENLAQVIETMQTSIDTVNGKVTNLNAQYTLKAQVVRDDGKAIMAGIALAATANNDMSGSEIVMMADRLVFADPASVNGTLKPIFTAGNVDGAPTVVIPANVMGDRMYPGRLLVDGSVEARSIKANEITGDKLKAGTISTREIDVSMGANLCPNSEFVDVTNNWPTAWYVDAGPIGGSISYGYGDSNWAPVAGRSVFLLQNGRYGNPDINAAWAHGYIDSVPVVGGDRYEFSVYTGAHRCVIVAFAAFYDSNGTFLSITPFDANATNNQEAAGGKTLTSFKRIGGLVSAPTSAATMRLFVRKGDTVAGQTNSYAFWTKPFIATANPNQTRLSPYTVSGLGTKITPGGITTPSLSALSATIGLLRTAASGARTEIRDNLILVYDGNNVLRVRMGVW